MYVFLSLPYSVTVTSLLRCGCPTRLRRTRSLQSLAGTAPSWQTSREWEVEPFVECANVRIANVEMNTTLAQTASVRRPASQSDSHRVIRNDCQRLFRCARIFSISSEAVLWLSLVTGTPLAFRQRSRQRRVELMRLDSIPLGSAFASLKVSARSYVRYKLS